MQAYDKMVDSGVDWIGLIPKGWAIEKVKRIFVKKNEKSAIMDPVVLSLARTGVKVRDISSNEGQLAASYDNYNPVEPGDILLNPMDLQSGANCSISKVEGVISPAYVNLRPIGNNNSQFFDYYFKLQYWSRAFFVHGRGISYDNRWTLGNETLMNYPVVVPAPAQQKSIADFLDEETAKIDNLIAKQEKLLKLLEEKRRATITHAVTRGLDPEVKLKETNIPWLGKIPTHWDIARTARLFAVNKESNTKLDSLKPMKYGFGEIVPKQVDINENTQEELRRYLLIQPQDIMINGLNLNYDFITQRVAIVKTGGCMTPAYISLRKRNEGVVPEYYKYLLKALDSQKVLNGWGNGIRLTLNYSELKKKELAKPPTDEQLKIVEYLDKYIEKSDDLKQKIQEQIKLLKERRTSLISHAVTGKIKV